MAYRKGARIVGFAPGFVPFHAVFHLFLLMVRVVDWLFYRIRITGRENLRGLRRAILVSNHTMIMDPAVIAHAIRPRRTWFTMLEETAMIPFLGTFVRLLGALPIPEGPGALLSLDAAAEEAMGRLGFLHVFPEGECYRWSQDLAPFRPGAFLLALRLNVPVVPITTVLHERKWRGKASIRVLGRSIPIPPVVTIVIGRPIPAPQATQSTGSHELRAASLSFAAQARQEMQAVIDEWGGSRGIYRGQMPRLVRHEEPQRAEPEPGAVRAARAI